MLLSFDNGQSGVSIIMRLFNCSGLTNRFEDALERTEIIDMILSGELVVIPVESRTSKLCVRLRCVEALVADHKEFRIVCDLVEGMRLGLISHD